MTQVIYKHVKELQKLLRIRLMEDLKSHWMSKTIEQQHWNYYLIYNLFGVQLGDERRFETLFYLVLCKTENFTKA